MLQLFLGRECSATITNQFECVHVHVIQISPCYLVYRRHELFGILARTPQIHSSDSNLSAFQVYCGLQELSQLSVIKRVPDIKKMQVLLQWIAYISLVTSGR